MHTLFLGNRCYDLKPEKDMNGAYVDWACRDMSPDLFHLTITNVMGLNIMRFVVDTDARKEVWNSAAVGYRLSNVRSVNASEASSYFKTDIIWSGTSFVHVNMRFFYVRESLFAGEQASDDDPMKFVVFKDYSYILELDADRNIIGLLIHSNYMTSRRRMGWKVKARSY